MLYERWKQIVREAPKETALYDLSRREQWTFAQLDNLAEQGSGVEENVVFPHGTSSDFIFAVLRGWRDRKVICPLEVNQQRPAIASIPAHCVHLKVTSATTGAARMVAFRGEQLAADADNIVGTMGLRRDWPNLGAISLAHSYGFSNLVLPLLLHGIPLVLVESPFPEAVRKAAELLPAVTLAAVPALWRVWQDAAAIPPNVKLAISAGAPLPLPLEREVYDTTGLKIHNFYGSSECGGIAYDRTETPRSDGSYVGSIMNNVTVGIDSNGCAEVRGAAVGERYWPEAADNLCAGVFRSSDLAELRGNNLFLRGRATDQINVAGRKVSPENIERVLMLHPGISDCVVFGVPSRDFERSDDIIACVATKACQSEELKKFLLSQLPAWQVPRDWWLRTSIERNGRGKISRAELRNEYLRSRQ